MWGRGGGGGGSVKFQGCHSCLDADCDYWRRLGRWLVAECFMGSGQGIPAGLPELMQLWQDKCTVCTSDQGTSAASPAPRVFHPGGCTYMILRDQVLGLDSKYGGFRK